MPLDEPSDQFDGVWIGDLEFQRDCIFDLALGKAEHHAISIEAQLPSDLDHAQVLDADRHHEQDRDGYRHLGALRRPDRAQCSTRDFRLHPKRKVDEPAESLGIIERP
jgi:hypothetical protein